MRTALSLYRSLFQQAGIESPTQYSAHSKGGHDLQIGQRGNGWDIKTLMEYVGWKNVQSAMRYVESSDPFSKTRINTMLASGTGVGTG
jgi:hypothetical protein